MTKLVLISTVLLLLTTSLSAGMLPEPTGHYQVGTTTFLLEDKSREESFTPEKGDFRRLVVQAWYPALASAEERAPYLTPQIREYLQEGIRIPGQELDQLQLSNSYLEAPIMKAGEEYPVVIYAHGFFSYEGDNFHLMEELASRGYIVYSINYSGISNISVYQGEVVARLAFNPFDENYILAMSALISRTMVEDTLFFIDSLHKKDDNNRLLNSLKEQADLENIGMLGYSLGGSAATVLTLLEDSPVKAGVNLDGDIILPETEGMEQVVGNSLSRPFLFLQSDQGEISLPYFKSTKEEVYSFSLKGTTHTTFTILSYLPSHSSGQPDSMSSGAYTEISKGTIIPFFDSYLKGNDDAMELSPIPLRADVNYKARNIDD